MKRSPFPSKRGPARGTPARQQQHHHHQQGVVSHLLDSLLLHLPVFSFSLLSLSLPLFLSRSFPPSWVGLVPPYPARSPACLRDFIGGCWKRMAGWGVEGGGTVHHGRLLSQLEDKEQQLQFNSPYPSIYGSVCVCSLGMREGGMSFLCHL